MKKEILIVDIETTGLLNQGGKIVEIGIVKLDLDTGNINPVYNSVIRETGFDISHTREPLGWIFKNTELTFEQVNYAPTLESQREIIQGLFDEYPATAYNKEFDFGFLKNRNFKIKELPCPMLIATPILNLPSSKGFGSPKYPSVEEAWKYLFSENNYIEAHRGLDDAKHEAKIVYKLFKIGRYTLPENIIHKDNSPHLISLKSEQNEFLEIESLLSKKTYKLQKNNIKRDLSITLALKWSLSDKNIELFRRIFSQLEIYYEYSHMCYVEIKDGCVRIGSTNGSNDELVLTKSLIYVDLLLRGLKPFSFIKEKYGNLPISIGTILDETNHYHLLSQIIYSVEELLIHTKIFNQYLEMGYPELKFPLDYIYNIYIPYYDFFNDYELEEIEEHGLPRSLPRFIINQDDIILKGQNNILLAINEYLKFINPQYYKGDIDIEKTKKKYRSISKEASLIFDNIDDLLKSWIKSRTCSHHFFMVHILAWFIKIKDIWIGYGEFEEFPTKGFFLGEKF